MSEPLIAVEIDTYNEITSSFVTLYLCNIGTVTATISGIRIQYLPYLIVPITIGEAITATQPSQSPQGQSIAGLLRFGLHDEIKPWLMYDWEGHKVRIYIGTIDNGYDGLSLYYTGRIEGLTWDIDSGIVTVTIVDARIDLDKPLVTDLYDYSEIEQVRGQPKPYILGRCYLLSPVLEHDTDYRYRISRLALDDVLELTVGGVPWNRVASNPTVGQWSPNLTDGTIFLGGDPLGGEVRVDAQRPDWDTFTAADAITEIITAAGGTVSSVSMAALNTIAPYRIGFAAYSPINAQDALDEIMYGIGGWWAANDAGEIIAGIIAPPDSAALLTYTDVEVGSCQLIEIVRPTYRLRVEYRRNWHPATQFYEFVTPGEQAAMQAGGVIAAAWGFSTPPVAHPRAIDAPLLRSVVNTEGEAVQIRDRLAAAWGIERRIYALTLNASPPAIYSTVRLEYGDIAKNFRIVSIVRSLGGGQAEIQLWG